MLSFHFSLTFKNQGLPETIIRAAGVIDGEAVTGIKGPSGSGKTTFLRVIAGLHRPDEGTITCGSRIWLDSTRQLHLPVQKRRVSLVFQDYALFPSMTVRKNVLYGAQEESFALHCLEMLGLHKELHKYPFQLSGGQQQRVAIGRALAARPELLLMDEPFSALDEELKLQLRMEIGQLFQDLKQSVVIVSHATDDLQALCSRVLTMKSLEENYRLSINSFIPPVSVPTGGNYMSERLTTTASLHPVSLVETPTREGKRVVRESAEVYYEI